jgi:hypothetical protein
MSRTIQVRIFGVGSDDRDAVIERFSELTGDRGWSFEQPWLGEDRSRDLFAKLFFDHVAEIAAKEPSDTPLSAAGFITIHHDEYDALALSFIMEAISREFQVRTIMSDPDNPLQKLREIELVNGTLLDGSSVESKMVSRPVFKSLPHARLSILAPQARESAYATKDERATRWMYWVGEVSGDADSFLEAEREAMRTYRAFSRLQRGDEEAAG